MDKVQERVDQLLGPWPVFFDGRLFKPLQKVFVVSIFDPEETNPAIRYRYWMDNMFMNDEGDHTIHFSIRPLHSAGFETIEDARQAFNLRAEPYIYSDKQIFQQALLNNIRIVALDVKR